MRKHHLVLTAMALLVASTAFAQKRWNGGAAGNWNVAGNWLPAGIPTAADDVILDNTNVATGYTVTLDNTAANVRTLTITPGASINITLDVPVANTQNPALTFASAGALTDTFVVNNGGRVTNNSGAAAGNVFNNLFANNRTVFAAGSYYLHNTARSFGTPFPATGNGAATFNAASTQEFGQASPTALSASGRTYGNLILSATAAKTYTATGASAFVIGGNLTLGSNVTFNTTMSGPFSIAGNITNNGAGGSLNTSTSGGITLGANTAISGSGTGLAFGTGGATVTTGGTGLTVATALGINGPVVIGATGFGINSGGTVTINSGGRLDLSGMTASATVASGGSLVVNGGGGNANLNCSAFPITGAGTVTIPNTGGPYVVIRHPQGITTAASGATGQIQTTTRTFPTGAGGSNGEIWEYAGSVDQLTGNAVIGGASYGTANANRIIVSNPNKVTLSQETSLRRLDVNAGVFEVSGGGTFPLNTTGFRFFGQPGTGTAPTVAAGAEFRIESGGAYISSQIVGGAGAFTVTNGGLLSIVNAAGITASGATGQIQTTTRNFGTTGQYVYAASAGTPVTGSGLPSSVATIGVQSGSVALTLTNDLTVNNQIQVGAPAVFPFFPAADGRLNITSGRTLTLAPTVTLASVPNASVGGTNTLQVQSGGRLVLNVPVTGSGTVDVVAGSTLEVADPAGIVSTGASGAVRTTTRAFAPGASYVYNYSGTQASAQSTGTGLPTGPASLTINNSATPPNNVTTLTQSTAPIALTINAGSLQVPSGVTFTHGSTLGTVNPAGELRILSGGTAVFNSAPLLGSGFFTADSGATLSTNFSGGFQRTLTGGAIRTSSRAFNSGLNFIYTGTATTGDGPSNAGSSTVASLTVNASGTVVMETDIDVTGTVSVQGGTLATNGQSLLLRNGASGTVASGGTLLLNSGYLGIRGNGGTISGAGTFTVATGAGTRTLEVSHSAGLAASGASGAIQTTTRTFSSDSTYQFLQAPIETGVQSTGDAISALTNPRVIINNLGPAPSTTTLNTNLSTNDLDVISGVLDVPSGSQLTLTGSGSTATGSIRVSSGGTAVLEGTVTGTGGFAALSGSNLVVSTPDGIAATGATGAVQTDTRSFATGASYSYVYPGASFTPTGPQVTGTGLPAAASSLTINNTATAPNNVTTLSAPASPASLAVAAGEFQTGSATLTLEGTASVASANGGMIRATSGGVLRARTPITSTGAVQVDAGSTFVIRNADGIAATGATGAVQTTTRTFSPGADYVYEHPAAATSSQVTGSALPSTVASLTIDNQGVGANGTTTLSNTLTSLGLISVVNGRLSTGANNLRGDAGASVAGALQAAPGGTLDTELPITGAGATTVEAGSTLVIRQTAGIRSVISDGQVQTATRTFDPGATYIYRYTGTQTAVQNTGDGLPATVGALFVNNTASSPNDATLLTQDVSAGTVLVSAGKLEANDQDLTVTSSGSVASGARLSLGTAGSVLDISGTGVTMTVNGTLDAAGQVRTNVLPIDGTGTFEVLDGGTFVIRNLNGLAPTGGQVTTTTRNYSVNGIYAYAGAGPMTTGSQLPASVARLASDLISPTDSLTLTQPVTVTGQLLMLSGIIVPGANTLTIPDDTTGLAYTAGVVAGTLTRTIASGVSGPRLFPVGTASGLYTPVSVTPSPLSAGTIAVSSTTGTHPNLPGPAAEALGRFWTITATGLTGAGSTLEFTWHPSDVGTSNPALYSGARFQSSTWTTFVRPTFTTVSGNTATVTGVTGFSDWTLFQTGPASVEDWSTR